MNTPSSLHIDTDAPSAWVKRFAQLIAPGARALDVACGGGRHTRLLRQHGTRVTAIDSNSRSIDALTGIDGVRALCADIENGPWPLAGESFDVIVVTNYLHRPLFPALIDALSERGLLIYETFMRGNERFGKPSNPDFLLQPGELLTRCSALTVLAFEQGEIDQPRPAVVQRICAVKGDAGLGHLPAA